jgi:hypothetical protein
MPSHDKPQDSHSWSRYLYHVLFLLLRRTAI